MVVDFHGTKSGDTALESQFSSLNRHKNLIISFPEFIGPKAEPIYLFTLRPLRQGLAE